MPKMTEGFFMRAESFYNFASYLDGVSNCMAYGGKSLHHQSHGESFLALFQNRFEHGLYILDEPEAALSPQRQLAFLRIIRELETPRHAQFLIATHSPILLAYPGATLYQFEEDGIREIAYRETDHYLVTKEFLNNPERTQQVLSGGRFRTGDLGFWYLGQIYYYSRKDDIIIINGQNIGGCRRRDLNRRSGGVR